MASRSFFGCYLLRSLDPVARAGSYIGCDKGQDLDVLKPRIRLHGAWQGSRHQTPVCTGPCVQYTGSRSTHEGASGNTMGRSAVVHGVPGGRSWLRLPAPACDGPLHQTLQYCSADALPPAPMQRTLRNAVRLYPPIQDTRCIMCSICFSAAVILQSSHTSCVTCCTAGVAHGRWYSLFTASLHRWGPMYYSRLMTAVCHQNGSSPWPYQQPVTASPPPAAGSTCLQAQQSSSSASHHHHQPWLGKHCLPSFPSAAYKNFKHRIYLFHHLTVNFLCFLTCYRSKHCSLSGPGSTLTSPK